MERKIGEIFKCNGDWYQCVEPPEKYDKTVCNLCDFHGTGNCELDRCSGTYRSDKKDVVFKKLEKVGEPYAYTSTADKIYNVLMQQYKVNYDKITPFVIGHVFINDYQNNIIAIEIKQTKKDMEEKKIQHYDCFFDKEQSKPNLKPFSLELAKQGKPVCTRDGRKARIICFDRNWVTHIVALVSNPLGESVHYYLSNGKVDFYKQNNEDLMMLPEKKEGWVNLYKSSVRSTKEEAMKYRNKCNDYIDTIKIEWEE